MSKPALGFSAVPLPMKNEIASPAAFATADAAAVGVLPEAAAPIRLSVPKQRGSPIEHWAVVSVNSGRSIVPVTVTSSPVLTIAAPATLLPRIGRSALMKVVRCLATVNGFPSGGCQA